MDVVPAFIVIDGVRFPLAADGRGVRIADDQRFPGLNALSYVSGHLIARIGSARVTELTQRQSLHHQALTASFIGPHDRDDLGDGVANWIRLAGRPPDLDDAYFVTGRMRRALVAIAEWCRQHRHDPVREQHRGLSRRMQGHYNYFAVRENDRAVWRLLYWATRIWRKWLTRRSQRSKMTWSRFQRLERALPLPRPKLKRLW